MKDSLYEQLVKDHPDLFEGKDFELSVGDGWYNIISSLMSVITSSFENAQRRLKWVKENPGTDPTGTNLIKAQAEYDAAKNALPSIQQVKEKFGGLRFYYQGGSEYLAGAVDLAEMMSGRTCEVCGKPGERRDTGWIKTLCNQHYEDDVKETANRRTGMIPAHISEDDE